MRFRSKLLLAAPPSKSNKITEAYLASETWKFLRDLKAMDPNARYLVLDGVVGISLNKRIFRDFGEFEVTMPYRGLLALNKIERIDYDDPKDLVKGTAKFLSRIINERFVEANPRTIKDLLRDILYRIQSGNLDIQEIFSKLGIGSVNYGSHVDTNYEVFNNLLNTTTFDSINELVWFIMMYLEKTTKWKNISQKEINLLEKSLKKEINRKIKDFGGSFRDEQEIVVTNKRLTVPRGTVVDNLAQNMYNKYIGYNSGKSKGFNDLLEKLKNYGISFGDEDKRWLSSVYANLPTIAIPNEQ